MWNIHKLATLLSSPVECQLDLLYSRRHVSCHHVHVTMKWPAWIHRLCRVYEGQIKGELDHILLQTMILHLWNHSSFGSVVFRQIEPQECQQVWCVQATVGKNCNKLSKLNIKICDMLNVSKKSKLTGCGIWAHSNLDKNDPPKFVNPVNGMSAWTATLLPGMFRSSGPDWEHENV